MIRMFTYVTILIAALCVHSGCRNSSTPQSGVFIGPGPIAGVHYSAPGTRGITDANGRFYYFEDETVTFALGDTELGKTQGKEIVTAFDLAGTEPIVGAGPLLVALENVRHPLHHVANVVTLLV